MAARRNGRATAVATVTAPIRAAVYTRKSSDETRDRNFTSLDNQRERGEAYAASQGWNALADGYDDGGFSGGNTDRPALKRLLADAEAGRLDIILVYKLDRLSRSLLDFLNLHRFLDAHGVQIVSVTEPIDTRTPMGRAFLNVLVSFGQLEREVASERTAHKIQAARRRGKWTGGFVPLGYRVEDRRLVPHKDEAEAVQAIFELYVASPSLIEVAQEANRRCLPRKSWGTKDGSRREGAPWNRVSLGRLLKDPVYIGKQKLGDEVFPGEHKGIVPKALFDNVQKLMGENRRTGGARSRNRHGFLLRGLLKCSACDTAMVSHPSRAHGKFYRFYTCTTAQKQGHATCPTKSVNADKIEGFVVGEIRRIGADPALQEATFEQAVSQVKARRRGLKLDARRITDELAKARGDVGRFVDTISRLSGPAADAVATQLGKAQESVAALEIRETEVAVQLDAATAMDIDRDAVSRALEQFSELWSVLLTPERERVLRILIERVDYRGDSGQLAITWRMAGFGEFVEEVAP